MPETTQNAVLRPSDAAAGNPSPFGSVAAPEAPTRPWATRLLDMPTLVAAHDPDLAQPWRVYPFVLDSTLAIVAGKGGAGKTWIIHEAADAVVRGTPRAGMTPMENGGRALIIDAEMGQWLTVDRFQKQGYSTDIQVFDAAGMDLRNPDDRTLIRDMVFDLRPNFIGWDSLRALVPSAKENDSDDMGPVVTWIRWLTRQSEAAAILVHHAGWREERTRGSSAIKDQADAVWYLGNVGEDGAKRLTCQGADLKPPRWCAPPPDFYLQLRPEGGLTTADAPKPAAPEREDRVMAAITAAPGQLTSARQVAEAAGYSSSNGIKGLLERLVDAGKLAAGPGGGFVPVLGRDPDPEV